MLSNEDQGASSYTSIGILIAIAGNVLISLALNLQKVAHKHLHDAATARARQGNRKQKNSSQRTTAANGTQPHTNGDSAASHLSRSSSTLYTATADDPQLNHPILESQPLLPRTASAPTPLQDYGALKSKKLFNIPRINIFRMPLPPSHPQSVLQSPMSPISESGILHEEDEHEGDGDELDESTAAMGTESGYLRSKLWWLGFVLMNIGEVGNFLSYAYAPASLVAPLGTVALVANCFFAPLLLHERFRKRDFFGILLAVFGSITIVLSSRPTDVRLDKDGLIHAILQPLFIAYTILNIVAILFLIVLSRGNAGRDWIFVDVGICALFGGYTVLSTKGLSTLLSLKLIQVFKMWITYPLVVVLLGTGFGQIRYLNRALMKFDSKHVIPTQFVMFNLSAIIGSAILYRDFENITLHKMISFLYGIMTVFLAIFILTYSPSVDSTGTALVSLDDPIAVLTSPTSPTAATAEILAEPGTAVNMGGGNRYVLRTKASIANIGISPGQYLLLAASPPTSEGLSRPPRDPERGDFGSLRARRGRSVMDNVERSRSPDGGRRRTIHFDGNISSR
ncbi:hypothetical protein FRC17_008964 [Serendipita sp. 399]|nr:hypothetical protein FRC17_008964 [Serendipita sp. 399]